MFQIIEQPRQYLPGAGVAQVAWLEDGSLAQCLPQPDLTVRPRQNLPVEGVDDDLLSSPTSGGAAGPDMWASVVSARPAHSNPRAL